MKKIKTFITMCTLKARQERNEMTDKAINNFIITVGKIKNYNYITSLKNENKRQKNNINKYSYEVKSTIKNISSKYERIISQKNEEIEYLRNKINNIK